MKPRISIVTVCYNSKNTLQRTMDSVAGQCYDNIEYVIIDGNSNDGTQELITSFINAHPQLTVVYTSEPDKGIYDAMNKGIKACSGDLICMLNSDDWLSDDALSVIAENYDGDKYCILYGLERRYKNNVEEYVGYHSHNYLTEGNIPHQTCYVPKACYDEFGAYSTEFRSAADYEFMLRMLSTQKVSFKPVCHVLANFTVGGMSAGAIGYIEEAKIKLKYGIINKKRYAYLILRAKFLKLIKQL